MYEDTNEFGNELSVGGALKENASEKPSFLEYSLQEWYDAKREIKKEYGIAYDTSYTSIYQTANESLGDKSAGGGLFQINMQYKPKNQNKEYSGSLNFRVENRHNYTNASLHDFGGEVGSAMPTVYAFNDMKWGVIQLYWEQSLTEDFKFIIGRLQPIAYIDSYAFISPFTGFLNQSFSWAPTMAIPASGFGIAGGTMLNDNIYLTASLSDANADNTKVGFDTFFQDREYFKHVEFGFIKSLKEREINNVHMTLWHSDEREKAKKDSAWGVGVSGSWKFEKKWVPFIRASYSDGNITALSHMISTGIGYQFDPKSQLALGLSWGKPSSGNRDQITSEIFYRMNISKNLQVTPDIQYIKNPSNNLNTDSIFLAGLRLRVLL